MHMNQAAAPHNMSQKTNHADAIPRLAEFIRTNSPLFVLTGAGCSTGSGIPDYRDENGQWKQASPVQYRDFVQHHSTRQRYWARSMAGYQRVSSAAPNEAHRSLAALEQLGWVSTLVTQNVDGLHQKAGQHSIIELHGSLKTVKCLHCDARYSRKKIQSTLNERNPHFRRQRNPVNAAPDGDALLEHRDVSAFAIPDCVRCGGVLKPGVVFFGESVPKHRVDYAFASLQRARGMMIVGTSLFVYSGYRFSRFAADNNIPIAAVNLGATRADDDFALKIEQNCGDALQRVHQYLQPSRHWNDHERNNLA